MLDSSISTAPDGVLAIGLDDAVTGAVEGLTKMLNEQNTTVTHFIIGSQVVNMPSAMTELWQAKPAPHVACHSWAHLQLPLFTDEEVVADLGWCQQIVSPGQWPMHWVVQSMRQRLTVYCLRLAVMPCACRFTTTRAQSHPTCVPLKATSISE